MDMPAKERKQLRGYLVTKLFTHLYSIVYYILATILLAAGIIKIYDASGVISVLTQLSFLNESAITLIATILPIIELGLGIALLLNWQTPLTLKLTVTLLAIFFGFSMYGMVTNLQGDCGCFGSVIQSKFGLGMVIRNLLLLLASGYLLVKNHTGN